MTVHSEWVDVDGMRVMARVGGERGQSLLFIAGLALSSMYWSPLLRRLAERHRVFAPDPPGFGRSSKARGAVTVREHADDVLRYMDAIGLTRAVLVGNSLGAQTAIELAAHNSDRVDKVVLCGATPDPRARTAMRQYARVLANFPLETPAMNAIYWRDYALAGIPRMVGTLRRTCDDPIEAKLPLVRAETLVVRGSRDVIAPQDWCEEIARLLPRGRLAVVRGVAHNAHYAAPETVATLVDAFVCDRLDEVDATRTAA